MSTIAKSVIVLSLLGTLAACETHDDEAMMKDEAMMDKDAMMDDGEMMKK
ncbi:MAG: hypothetical protein GKR98_07255 [Boseongicola sp.]|nr:MAG: hypothetical protein GKR98_07255 [Boseongicola sp.]